MDETRAQQALAGRMRQRLTERLGSEQVEVIDESGQHAGHAGANGTGFGSHFRVRITSLKFAGLNRVVCHRFVYDALHDFMAMGLHALAVEAENTPADAAQ